MMHDHSGEKNPNLGIIALADLIKNYCCLWSHFRTMQGDKDNFSENIAGRTVIEFRQLHMFCYGLAYICKG